jgi:hypothetical protein
VYFEEIAALREGAAHQVEVVAKSTVRKRGNHPLPIILGAAAVALALVALWLLGSAPRGAGSRAGLSLGAFAGLSCFACAAIALRRRIRKIPFHFQRWTQVHIALGSVGFLAALLHANWALHGWLSGTLLVTFAGVFLTGWLGFAIYKLVPPIVTRIEGDTSQLVEDVENERQQLRDEVAQMTADAPAMAKVARAARKAAGGLLARIGAGYNPEEKAKAVGALASIDALIQDLPPDRQADARRVVTDIVRIAADDTHLLLYRLLRTWLALHIASTAVLLTLLVAHVGAVLWWFV